MSGQPPLAVIFDDAEHVSWTLWDYRLFKAHHILQDWYRDGIPVWVDESDRVTFDAVGRISKSRAAIERAQDASSTKGKKPVPGRYFVAEPRVIDGGELPTREEWLIEQQSKSSNKAVVSKFGNTNERSSNIVQGRK